VQDALANSNGMRPIFEPLHPQVSDIGKRFAHRALAPEDQCPELEAFFGKVCAGREIVFWTRYRRQRRWLFPLPSEFNTLPDAKRIYQRWMKFLTEFPRLAAAGRREEALIKCIRANLMLGWLSKRCGCRIVLMVRHPGAVIESELRGSWNANYALERFRNDGRLSEITHDRYRHFLERRLSPVEGLTLRWLIENQWVIEKAQDNGVTVVLYEHLKATPEREWLRILRALDLRNLPDAKLLARPSQQSSRRKPYVNTVSEPRWLKVLSRRNLALIQSMLDEARFNLYSTGDPNPIGVDEVAPASTDVARR
jgi:hypothetical protein